MSKKLDGKVALITGSTRSIGRAIAEEFLAEGASVVLSGRSHEKGALALKELDAGDRAHFVAADALEQDRVEKLVDQSVEHFGAVDILVNNTGGCDGFALIHELSDAAWNRALDWTLNSAFWATRRALPGMLERGWGRIICISSVEGKRASQPAIAPLHHQQARPERVREGRRRGVRRPRRDRERDLPRSRRDRQHGGRRPPGSRGRRHQL